MDRSDPLAISSLAMQACWLIPQYCQRIVLDMLRLWLPRAKHAAHRGPCLRTSYTVTRRFQGWSPTVLVVWVLNAAGQLKTRQGGRVITYNSRCQVVLLMALLTLLTL